MNPSQDSIDLTRVGPGTVMGNFMRQYWIPAAKSSELQRDGAPMRLMLLGEKLIAFRDTQGRVGVMDHRCPHRCASLFLGRNEDDGIRCIYHGWKFDVEGNCVDMPSVPPSQDFKDKVKARAFKVTERNGLIWVYMGPRQSAPPPLPMVEATLLAEGEVTISFMQRRCNWMQALEGDIDTSHFGFLHVGHLDPDNVPPGHPLEHTASERAPEYHVRDAPWGTSYGAYRSVRPGTTYWRFANYMFPFWTQTPQGEFPRNIQARAWVPLDDEHTMMIFWKQNNGQAGTNAPLKDGRPLGGTRPAPDWQPVSTDWLGRYRTVANESNDWLIDREWPVLVYVAVLIVIGYGPSLAWVWYVQRTWGGGRWSSVGWRFAWGDLWRGPVAYLIAIGTQILQITCPTMKFSAGSAPMPSAAIYVGPSWSCQYSISRYDKLNSEWSISAGCSTPNANASRIMVSQPRPARRVTSRIISVAPPYSGPKKISPKSRAPKSPVDVS